MKTLHIHIGTPKTGTTAIQKFCINNKKVLESKGYCYPLFPISYEKVSDDRNGHFLVGDIKNPDGSVCAEKTANVFRSCMQVVHELFQTFDHIILSDESIWWSMDTNRKNLWKDLMQEAEAGGFCLRTAVYLRRQDRFLFSLYRQSIKSRNRSLLEEATFDEYMQKINFSKRFKYHTKLDRMAKVIGKEHITVRRYAPDGFAGGSIYADFLSVIGLCMTEAYTIPEGIANASLNGNTHEFKRVLNGLAQLEDTDSNLFIMNRLRECSQASEKAYPSELFSKEETETFLKQFEKGNRKVAKEYLHEPNADLFDRTVKDLPKWEKDNPYVADDLTRFIGVTGIWLYQDLKSLRQEIRDLKQEIREVKKNSSTGFLHKIKHSLKKFI